MQQQKARFPAVHGDSGFAMTTLEVLNAPKSKEFRECPHCHAITDDPCGVEIRKDCWEDWADLLADAPGG